MIRYYTNVENVVSQLFMELIIVWKPFLLENVNVSTRQSKNIVNNNFRISIDFTYADNKLEEKKFIEYESMNVELFPGTLKFFKSYESKIHIDLYHCKCFEDLRRILYSLQFTKSYQNILLKYVS